MSPDSILLPSASTMSVVSTVPPGLVDLLRAHLGPSRVISGGLTLETLSKDFYWYSPILKRLLDDRIAALAVRVSTLDELADTLAACWREKVPIVPRGGGTGNYGQAVPLHGGVVIDLSTFDSICSISHDGVVRAQPGVRLATIEANARALGWQLRCLPSTWVKSTLAGFLCGGFGGIGSITWGPLAASETVKSVTLMTCEEIPKLVRLEGEECRRALHAYGTTGIIVEIEMRLAPKSVYEQLALGSTSWEGLLDWTDWAARNTPWHKRMVSQCEWPVPSFFKPLRAYFRDQQHVSFVLVERDCAEEVIASATKAGVDTLFRSPLEDPPRSPLLTDYSWNHTTLWAMKADPRFTYIQCGYSDAFREQFKALRGRFPEEVLLNVDWIANQVSPHRGPQGALIGENLRLGGLPLVRFTSEERLQEIMAYCSTLGIRLGNPHGYTLLGNAAAPDLLEKSRFKSAWDAQGLLNPGKLSMHPVNPFA